MAAAQAQRHQSSGIPAWAWFLIVPGLVILALVVITMIGAFWESNETPRHAVRRERDAGDELRRIEAEIAAAEAMPDDDAPVLTYPAIPTSHAPEVVPYPESPSAPVAPAPSASLMDRLGK
ncbi:hypothetical protein [Mycobacteroides abscessus]|uniref:hypothetical protein n=1 Tax=Mycobacteroides abscessus TaxID=36809 RepID=UPI000C265965|nr:hypothetical protein [Mycobacteroides abscessus]